MRDYPGLLDETEPFFIRYKDRVIFSRGNTSSISVDIIVRHSELSPELISGYVLGGDDEYRSLERVFTAKGDVFCSIESIMPAGWPRLSSKKVHLKNISHTVVEDPSTEAPKSIVGEFICYELFVDETPKDFGDIAPPAQLVKFTILGNSPYWPIVISEMGPDGFKIIKNELEFISEKVALFTAIAKNDLIYDKCDKWARHIRAEEKPVLYVESKNAAGLYPREQFLQDATVAADDICLLISFISKSKISWCQYSYFGDRDLKYIRPAGQGQFNNARQKRTQIVPFRHPEKFIGVARRALRYWESSGYQLRLPIVYFIASSETDIIDEGLSYSILCLERLLDIHAEALGMAKIMRQNTFDRVRRAVLEATEHTLKNDKLDSNITLNNYNIDDVLSNIREKIPELNRPSFWGVLRHACEYYGIKWSDLYPPGTVRPSLIGTRNKFIHSSAELDPAVMIRERIRIQTICERIILRMLGWLNLNHLDSFAMRQITSVSP